MQRQRVARPALFPASGWRVRAGVNTAARQGVQGRARSGSPVELVF